LILNCLNSPVCIFVSWKIKHNWGESVVKGSEYKELKKGAKMFRDLKNHQPDSAGTRTKKKTSTSYKNQPAIPTLQKMTQRWTVTFTSCPFSEGERVKR